MNKQFYIYILASKINGTLYIGVTSNSLKRIWQHENDQSDGFTKQHNIKQLLHFEQHETAESAITREKQLKMWNRAWKLKLIEKDNPDWKDLYDVVLK